MTAFLIFFLVTYSGMHLFVFWHAKVLLPDRWLVLVPAILFLALMVVSPIAVRLLEKNGSFQSAHWVANVGYWWMGFLFLSFCGLLLVRALGLLVRVASAAFSSTIPCAGRPDPNPCSLWHRPGALRIWLFRSALDPG